MSKRLGGIICRKDKTSSRRANLDLVTACPSFMGTIFKVFGFGSENFGTPNPKVLSHGMYICMYVCM